jgi:hypothetical protein
MVHIVTSRLYRIKLKQALNEVVILCSTYLQYCIISFLLAFKAWCYSKLYCICNQPQNNLQRENFPSNFQQALHLCLDKQGALQKCLFGRAMAQIVSRRSLTAEARVRARVNPCGPLWWTKWHWDRFFSEFVGFPLSVSFRRRSPNSYHLGNA